MLQSTSNPSPRQDIDDDTLALNVDEVSRALGIGRNRVYDEINAGRLEARKFGRRTLVPRAAALRWLAALPHFNSAA